MSHLRGSVCGVVLVSLAIFIGCGDGEPNHSPVASDDYVAVDEDTPITIPVLDNDVDADGDPLQVVAVTQPAQGSIVLEADDTVTYTPQNDFNGTDGFSYTVEDVLGASASASVEVTVVPVNDPPGFTAGADVTVDEDCGPQTVSAWATGISAGPGESGQTPTFDVAVDTNPALFAAAPQIDAATGDLTFAPAGNAFGSASLTVTLSDDGGGTDTSAPAGLTINIVGVNDSPSFSLGSDVTVDEDCGPQMVNAWATGISAGPGESGQTLIFDVTVDSNPALFLVAPGIDPGTGDLTFTPADDAYGSADITVTLSDNGGGSDTSAPWASTIYVAAVNDPPSFTAGADVTVDEDCGPQTVSAWATDISAGPGESGQTLTFDVTVDTNPALFAAAPQIDATTGDLTFAPAGDAFGSADVTVTLSDDGGGADTSAPAALAITVTGSNDAPAAVDDVANVPENGSADIAVLGNDSDPDGDTLTVLGVTQPTQGTASINPDDTIAYQPELDFSGVDSFTYTVSDGNGAFSTATVSVGVCRPLNNPPSTGDDVASTDTDTVIRSLAVLANDTDPDWDTLSIESFTQPAAGVVTLNDDGTLFYTPPNNGDDLVGGTDSFTYVVHDGRGGLATATVSISVTVVSGPIESRKAALTEKCHAQMYQVGVALHRYRADYGGLFPPWLHDLVPDYLPSARLLICPLDATCGAVGGKPTGQYPELREGSSYMYEFNMAADCSWDWSWLNLPGPPADPGAFIDLDGDPSSSKWGEVKTAQMTYGDAFHPSPYPSDLFPLLRCFWHADDPDTTTEKSISNLSFDCTIFLSTLVWEWEVP